MTNVGVCFPSNGTVHAAFTVSLVHLVMSAGVPCAMISAESADAETNRNNGIFAAREAGCSHILFLDTDMTFHPATISRLLGAQKDIIGCQYVRRVEPYGILGVLKDQEPGEIKEAIELPTGCLLVKLPVFEKLRAPYFRRVAMEAADRLPPELEGIDASRYTYPTTLSEDFYFSLVARRAGFRLWCDIPLSMEIEHYGQHPHRIGEE